MQTAGVARGYCRCGNTAPTAFLRVLAVIIVARWGTLGKPPQAVSQPKHKSVKVVQEPGVERDCIQNGYPILSGQMQGVVSQ